MIARLSFAAAFAAVIAAPLTAQEIGEMSDAARAQFRAEVRAYLMENPEVLLEAINVLEARQAAAQAQGDTNLIAANAAAIFADGYSFVGGNPDGDVTMVEFMDYRCGYCKRAFPEVAELLNSDGNIRYVIKEFPILGAKSVLASQFAIAVKQVQGDAAYFDIHETLMTMRSEITEQALADLSDDRGYDTKTVFKVMNSDAVQQVIAANRALAQRLNISGTPSFVLKGRMMRGYVPLEGMRQVVAQERG